MLVERFGPIVINISRVINDIFTLIITYGILVIAFAFGLVFILDDTSHMVTADEGSSYFRPNDGTIGTFWRLANQKSICYFSFHKVSVKCNRCLCKRVDLRTFK